LLLHSYEGWTEEKEYLERLNMKDFYNLERLSLFLTQTVDKIATSINNDEGVPEFLFDIRSIIVSKIPEDREKFNHILKSVEKLKKGSEYDISVASEKFRDKFTSAKIMK
jgi:hypothetical protein